MKRKNWKYSIIAALVLGGCLSSVSASAITPDDVAAKAREAGWPESLIQAGYNQWASGNFSEDDLLTAYNSISDFNDDTQDMIDEALGGGSSTPAPETPATEAPAQTPAENNSAAPSGGGNTAPAENTAPETPVTPETPAAPAGDAGAQTVTKKDGTTEARIPASDFVNMTFEQKQEYVNSLDDTSRQQFISSLSTEERNSMLKQMPMEDKAAFMQKYIDVANDMGVNVTVDSLSENNISLTVRDENGTVIDKAAVGITIDETGLSHTRPLLVAVGGSLLALAGFGGLYYYIRKTEE